MTRRSKAPVPSPVDPEVGLGATYRIGGDEHPMTITEVSACGRRLGAAFDYVYAARLFVPGGATERFFVRDDAGTWRREHLPFATLEIGSRRFAREPVDHVHR